MKNLFNLGFAIIAYSLCSLQNVSAQTQPTVNACCMTLNTQTTTTLNFDWVRGNGEYCLVVMRQTSNSIAAPTDGSAYSSSTTFGFGSNLGNSNYVVYKGTGTSVTVTNLGVGTYYEAMVYEFNSLTFPYVENYTSSYGYLYMYTLAAQPTSGCGGLNAYNIGPNNASLSWTPGNGTYSILGVRASASYSGAPADGTEYSSSLCFGSGGTISTVSPYTYSCYDGVSSSVGLSCLGPQTDYSCCATTFNGTSGANNYFSGSYDYFTTQASEPTNNDTYLGTTDASDNAFTITWLKPLAGAGVYSLVTIAQGAVNNYLPLDFTPYTANSVYGSGSLIGSAYVIYNGTGNGMRVTGLTPGVQYCVSVYEFNGGSGTYNRTENYLTSAYLSGTQTTNSAVPTVSSSGLVLTPSTNSVTASWTSGNGAKRVVEVKPYRVKTALGFDGSNDYVSVPYSAALQPTTYVTCEAWAYKSDWSTTSGWQVMAGNQENGGYSLFMYNTQLYGGVSRAGFIGYAYSDIAYATPGWHHFALTYDGRYVYVYLDGQRVAQNDAGANYPIDYGYSNSFIIGSEAGTSTTPTGYYFNGMIDEVRVWNTCRTITEIRNARNNSMDGNETGLIADWRMDDGYTASSLVKNNSLSPSLDGTLSGIPTTAASAFTNTSGWALSGAVVDLPTNFNTYNPSATFLSGDNIPNKYFTTYNSTGN